MISDVPIGAFLSGGIDSSLIVSLMQSLSKNPINTFTIGFNVPGYNEAEHAMNISKHLGTNHTELYLSEKDTLSTVNDLSNIWDEPFADSSQIPTLILSRLTKKSVSVALTGDGGDEIFCGYNRYSLGFNLYKYISKFPTKIRLALSELLQNIPTSQFDKYSNFIFRGNKIPAVSDKLQKLNLMLSKSLYIFKSWQ
jgi:asparagine synthase (glutamine-hydrolysing)